MRFRLQHFGLIWVISAMILWGQQPEHEPGPGPDRTWNGHPGPPGDMPSPPMRPNRSPLERRFHAGPSGRWWGDPELAQRLGLTADQQKRMEAIFQQSRLKLIDLSAALQKEEAVLEPMLGEDRPDEEKILSQIDRIAQARAELEKANARMLLGIRGVLTQDQWKKLQERSAPPREPGRE